MNYYNDNDKFSVKWLKSLIDDKLILEGGLDTKVDNALAEHNLKVEVCNGDGRWEQSPDVK